VRSSYWLHFSLVFRSFPANLNRLGKVLRRLFLGENIYTFDEKNRAAECLVVAGADIVDSGALGASDDNSS